jgi:uncharacterized protein YjbI with pentapeptide repeats
MTVYLKCAHEKDFVGNSCGFHGSTPAFICYIQKCAGVNLAGANLTSANLAGVNLAGANLSGANLSGANLIGANLINADLSNADLSNSCLSYDFSKSYFLNWEDDLPRSSGHVTMHLGSYSYVTPKGKERQQTVHIWKRWNGEDWVSSRNCTNYDVPQNANAFQANLSGANLSGAHLVGVNLAEADLNKANLVRTNLGNANLRRANFENANLSGANLLDANLEKANFHGAIRDGSLSNNKGTHKAYYDAKLKAQTERTYPKPPGSR